MKKENFKNADNEEGGGSSDDGGGSSDDGGGSSVTDGEDEAVGVVGKDDDDFTSKH